MPVTVELDTEGMKPGDYAGLAALQWDYGTVGIKVDSDHGRRVVVSRNRGDGVKIEDDSVPFSGRNIFLKIAFDFENGDIASFYYSPDGMRWVRIGSDLQMRYSLRLFIGYRIGIYCYSEKEAGGFADFHNFCYKDTILK
jgi:beta-xylosidase